MRKPIFRGPWGCFEELEGFEMKKKGVGGRNGSRNIKDDVCLFTKSKDNDAKECIILMLLI